MQGLPFLIGFLFLLSRLDAQKPRNAVLILADDRGGNIRSRGAIPRSTDRTNSERPFRLNTQDYTYHS